VITRKVYRNLLVTCNRCFGENVATTNHTWKNISLSLFEKLCILSSRAEGVFFIGNVKMLGVFFRKSAI